MTNNDNPCRAEWWDIDPATGSESRPPESAPANGGVSPCFVNCGKRACVELGCIRVYNASAPASQDAPEEARLPKVASDAMYALAKYLQTHDEMYLMDSYRTLRDAVDAPEPTWDWELEAREQMGAKLEAQNALRQICIALDLHLATLGNGWTEALPKILARIEEDAPEADDGTSGSSTSGASYD